ncbi:MAG TPA: 2'-5' RNA ligase family protein [Rectinemataceae bacterium]|nr:2'-5' RNA ligase family protein [Rectinemataceae bacterium]
MRVFIGLPLPMAGKTLAGEFRNTLGYDSPGLVWLAPDMLHLTLSFLGELDDASLAAARRALSSFGAPVEPDAGKPDHPRDESSPPSFRPRRLSFFPKGGQARVLVLTDEAETQGNGQGPKPPAFAETGLEIVHSRLCRALAREAKRSGIPALDTDWPDADLEGSRPRRAFTAHISLARLKGGLRRPNFEADRLEKAAALIAEARPLLLDRLVLFESRLGRAGASYEILEELSLSAAGANSPL